ncbi:MAG TPA: hypothetical protein PLU72_05105 [Candidatus Ozemobacteraceae bacterium]|nr:hypothetical protein [Candidatus Ozemobacteraceae bacterium]
MDRNRWLVVLAVVCMMIVTLTVLRKISAPTGEGQEQVVAVGGTSDPALPDEPAVSARASNRPRQMAAPVDLSPPPRFFLAVATPEEDGKEMQDLAERGKALKPDAFTASGTARTGGSEGRK